MLKFIDLFCGIGGIRLGLKSIFPKAECVFSSDINVKAQKTYSDNFGEVPEGDITKIDEKNIPLHDILLAGFPCQAFSISGRRKGFEDTRGTLFFDVARIIKHHKPKVVLCENVKGLLSHDKGKTLEIIKNTFEELGYKFYYKLLNSKNFGVPQNRERVYMVAIREDLEYNFKFPTGSLTTETIETILDKKSKVNHKKYPEQINVKNKMLLLSEYLEVIPKNNHKPFKLFHFGKGGQGQRVYSIHSVGVTVTASTGGWGSNSGLYYIQGEVRPLFSSELLRLQGFPWLFILNHSETQSKKLIGNSVSVPVVSAVMREIAKVFSKNRQKKMDNV